jgi:hypothetical protein
MELKTFQVAFGGAMGNRARGEFSMKSIKIVTTFIVVLTVLGFGSQSAQASTSSVEMCPESLQTSLLRSQKIKKSQKNDRALKVSFKKRHPSIVGRQGALRF